MVCEANGKKRSDFTGTKSKMVEHTCKHSTQAQVTKHACAIHLIENQKLAKYAGSSDWAILQPIDFEFRSHDTPQYNSLVQLIFLYLPEKVHSMRGGAKVLDGMHHNVAL